jgi:superfamily I DNA/RNA helicase
VKKLEAIASEKDLSLLSVIQNIEEYDDFSPRTKNSLISFYNELAKISQRQSELSLSELISWMIGFTGYIDEIKRKNPKKK